MISPPYVVSMQAEHTCSGRKCKLCGALCLWHVQDCHAGRGKAFFACLLVNLLYTDDIFIKWLPSEGRPKDAFQDVFLF